MKIPTTSTPTSSTASTSKTPTEQTQYPNNTSTSSLPTTAMSFRMPDLEALPEFSDGDFRRWFRGIISRLRANNDIGGVVIPPPAAVMVEIIEFRTSGTAAAFLSSSAPIQSIINKDDITENDLDTMVNILWSRFPSSITTEAKEEPAEQKKNPAKQTSLKEPKTSKRLNDPSERRSPGEQLRALSQGENTSAEEYYQQALAALHAFNLEDKNYNVPETEPAAENMYDGLLHSFLSVNPSHYVHICVITTYLRGIYDEEFRERIANSVNLENSTLADVYDYVKTCSEIFVLQDRLQKKQARLNNGCEQQ